MHWCRNLETAEGRTAGQPKVGRTGPGIHSALGVGDRHIDREHRGDKEPRYVSRRHLGECKWHRHVMSDLRRDISVCEIGLRHKSACAVQKKEHVTEFVASKI